ncbi:hypothetical protein [Duganella callida]|uniref:Uncharacterized protein n=1 Tax=Duganella callida TaxID=2561932 RepID=A0A4Y9S7S4_9BURK|nr:hypothetical protein [Duganella callida]TFW16120.1 hypothetical protein E4L98_24575 [Duganella callida]
MRILAHTLAMALAAGPLLAASAAEVQSISRLAAGPDDILFVADWKAARVHAITLPPATPPAAGAVFNILDLEPRLARQVGGARVSVEDMVARPGSGEVLVAFSYGPKKLPALVAITADGSRSAP